MAEVPKTRSGPKAHALEPLGLHNAVRTSAITWTGYPASPMGLNKT